MAQARRAAEADESPVVELGTFSVARRSAAPRRPSRRRVVVPLAVLASVSLGASLVIGPLGHQGVESTDPTMAAPMRVSRDEVRPELSPSASPSPTVSASPSVIPNATPSATSTAAPTPSPSASPAPAAAAAKAAPAPDYTTLGEDAGTRYATDSVNVRSGPGTGYDAFTTLASGRQVTITERTADGWQQVSLKGKPGWIKATFLSETAPKASGGSSSGDSGFSDAQCKKAGGLEQNLTSRTASVLRALCAKFPGVSSYGGYRPGSGSYHGSGQAIDVMVSGDYGWQIAKWARSNASSLGVIEVIYQQQIWTSQRSGDGWRSMSDRGSASANHWDHVHISVR